MTNSYLKHDIDNAISIITLDNPQRHNAFDDQLIHDFRRLLKSIENEDKIKVVLIRAQGKNFSAGANLAWMQKMADYDQAQNKTDALALAHLLHQLSTLKKPVIVLAQGKTLGGGIGLIACADIVIASEQASFCFSEVKLGLIPATIAPYIIRSLGFSAARYYFLSAKSFDALRAQQLGLVHQLCPPDALWETGLALAKNLLEHSPAALSECKKLLNTLCPIEESMLDYTAELLAQIRNSPQGQEGLQAFLAKRAPNWPSQSSE